MGIPDLRGRGFMSNYHMTFCVFKQQYVKFHENILILRVDFDKHILSEFSIQNQSESESE